MEAPLGASENIVRFKARLRGDLHTLNGRLQQRMLTPSTRPLGYGKALAVVFRKNHNLLGLVVAVKHFHLNLHIWIHANIEDFPPSWQTRYPSSRHCHKFELAQHH